MIRLPIILAFVLVGSVGASFSAPINFSTWRCEDKDFIKVLEQKLKGSVVEGGRSLSSYGAFIEKVLSSKTVSATRNKLICDLKLKMTGGGASQTIHGRETIQQFANGKLTMSLTIN